MQIPFTTEQFFDVFRQYNSTIWPAQVLLLALAVLAVVYIALRRPWSSMAVSIILALLWVWLGAAYHMAFFARINPVAYGFGALSIVGGLLFAWHGVFRESLQFAFTSGVRTCVGLALIVFALIAYPVWVTVAGHAYPELPTFGLPCPTTIFTIGLLALSSGPGLRAVLTVPMLWSLVGSQAAFLLDVKPDLGLLAAGAVGIGLFVWPARAQKTSFSIPVN
jgi:peptidoglycan/LPS O-acetylase OafA/YrhL